MKRWRVLFLGGLVLLLTAAAVEIALRLTPVPASLQNGTVNSTEFLDRHGTPLRTLLAEERRYARRVPLEEISRRVIDATLSAEDKRFQTHGGVDLAATGRAIYAAIRERHASSGASTITQQLIKIATPGPRTVTRKAAEIWRAVSLERRWGKDQILHEYLNRLDYGNLQTGIASASRFYFGKPASDLSAAEAAFLAGLPKAPGKLNPHADFEAARNRQHWVLQRMHRDGALSAAELQRAILEPLLLLPPGRQFEAPHFIDLLLRRQGLLSPAGGRIHTALDLGLNQMAERTLHDQLAKIADKNATSGAVVVIDNPTGEVLALAGSGDYFQTGAGQVNGAWIIRSPGSAVKPFTYLLALQRGANPGDVVPDVPTDFFTPTGLYRPNNYNHRFYGPVSLRFALGNSLNVAAIRTLQMAGGPDALQRCLQSAGITTLEHPADYYGLGLTLGNGEVRLLELANAFATLGRLGLHRPYRLLRRNVGDVESGLRIFDPRAAYLVADMLADNSARAAFFDLNSYLAFDFPVACKTGTSSDYRDNWAVGYTPEFTVAVWVGNPDGSPMRGITGVTGAAPVMHEVFMHLRRQHGTSWFSAPPGIQEQSIHPLTGRLVSVQRAGAVTEKCLWPVEPERLGDYGAAGRVVLAPEYSNWMRSHHNMLGEMVACDPSAGALRIVRPLAGTVFFLDPDLPLEAQRLALRAEAPARVTWSSDSLRCESEGDRARAQLREGVHVISARDAETGRAVATWIEVKAL